jgi:alkaline phosphatase
MGQEGASDSASGNASIQTLPSQAPENYVSLAEYEIANYRIVYEDGLPGAVTKKITNNLTTLQTKIGVTMQSVSDAALAAPDGMPEILIGKTNREESKKASAMLRSGEYSIKYNKETNNVVIAGGSASALGAAVDKFFKDGIDLNKRYLAISNTYKVEKFLDFPIQSVLINGVPIQEYAIVYPKDADLVTKYAAQNLVDYLQTNMGVKLTMNPDSKAEKQYEILIGKTKRTESKISTSMKEGQYVLAQKDDKIIMQGNGIYVGAAVGTFVSKYIPSNGNKKQIEINNLSTSTAAQTHKFPSTFRNAIIMIGDGMGFNHVEAAKNANMGEFFAEQFPNKGKARTRSQTVINGNAEGYTDSAAAATALATGYKTLNGRVGVDKNGNNLKNIRELADEKNAKTAVVTTDVIGGATPGGFLAHNKQRKVNNVTNPDIINQINTLISQKKVEYTMGRSADSASAPNPDILTGAREALDIIAAGNSQFFLMVEGAYIDKQSHNDNLSACVEAVKQYNEVIAYITTFVFCHPDTALIVTADHETGALTADSSKQYGYKYTNGSSSYRQHTNNDVPVYALGPKTEYFDGYRVENVCIPHFAAQAFGDSNFGDPNYTKNRDKI